MAKMIMSLSFKNKEANLWEHLQKQLNASYYIKNLILADLSVVSNEKKIDTTLFKTPETDDGPDLEIDF